jgi:hypothetical protein
MRAAGVLINRDYPLVQAVVFVVASSFVLVNLLVDLLYPRDGSTYQVEHPTFVLIRGPSPTRGPFVVPEIPRGATDGRRIRRTRAA